MHWLSWMWDWAGAWFVRDLGSVQCDEDGLKCGVGRRESSLRTRLARDTRVG